MKLLLVFIVLIGECSNALATLKVRQSLPEKSYATLEMSNDEDIKIGNEIIFTKAGKQCLAKVSEISGKLFNVNTKGCAFKNEIAVGDIAEKPLLETKDTALSTEPYKKAFAAETKFNAVEKLGYLPAQGVSFFNAGLAISNLKGATKTSTGTFFELKNSTTYFSYGLLHGLSNSLSFGLTGSLQTRSAEYTYGNASTVNGTTETTKTSGWAEPEFALIWRANGDSESDSKTHVLFGIKPKLQASKYATSTADGNPGNGGSEFKLSASFFKEVNNLELELALTRTTHTITDSTNASDSTKSIQSDLYNETAFNVTIQGPASEKVILGGILSYNLAEGYSTTSYTDGSKTSTQENGSASTTSGEFFSKFKIDQSSFIRLSLGRVINYSQSLTLGSTKLNVDMDWQTAIGASWFQEF